MLRSLRSASSGERGGAIFEFMLVLPLLLGLALGVWEFGRIFDAQLVATNAAREGARKAAVGWSEANLSDAVRDRVMSYLQAGYGARLGDVSGGTCEPGYDVCLDPSDITVEFSDGVGAPDSEAVVTVPIKVRVFQNFLPGLADPLTLSGQASMRIQ